MCWCIHWQKVRCGPLYNTTGCNGRLPERQARQLLPRQNSSIFHCLWMHSCPGPTLSQKGPPLRKDPSPSWDMRLFGDRKRTLHHCLNRAVSSLHANRTERSSNKVQPLCALTDVPSLKQILSQRKENYWLWAAWKPCAWMLLLVLWNLLSEPQSSRLPKMMTVLYRRGANTAMTHLVRVYGAGKVSISCTTENKPQKMPLFLD